MKRRTVFILAACLAAFAFLAATVGIVALALRQNRVRSAGGGGRWASTQYLDVHLDSDLPEQSSAGFGNFLERRPATLRTIVQSLDRAAKDTRIKSVVLRVNTLPGVGWGKIEEVRDAISRFRKTKKPVYAYLEFAGNKEYYLATACSKIYAVPTGHIDVSGLRAEVMFFRNTLDKLGVVAEFEGVGKYKNAPNQFTESGFTEPHREQMEALLDSLFGHYVKGVADARGISEEKVRTLIDGGPYDAREAKEAGLVDGLLYRDEVAELIENARRITPARYARSGRGLGLGRPKFALIYVVGEITLGPSQEDAFGSSANAGSDTIAEAIRDAREDEDVKAILLRVDSPGGSGTASDVIWREVALARKGGKTVIASMGDVAASGGYYVSMGSDAIVAQPGTITGSIGVFAGKFSLHGFYDKIGITKEIVKRGAHSDIFTDYRQWTPEERARIQAMMASFYEDFLAKAAVGRHRTPEEIHEVAQGRVWTGTEALEKGLIDRLGGLDVAVALAREKTKIAADQEVDLVVLPERKGFFETLLEQEDNSLESRLPGEIQSVLRWARTLNDGAPSARLPVDLRIR